MSQTVTWHVPDISCEHCVKTIQRVVTDEVDGIASVEGDHEAKNVTIVFGPPATQDRIAAVMAEWDFPPQR